MKTFVALLLTASLAQASITAKRFVDVYTKVRQSSKISETTRTKLASTHYVFVAGFLNEALPGYFADNIEGLKSLGIPESHIHILYPCSGTSITENVAVLHKDLSAIADEAEGKLVIIAHSKGALVQLRHALENPELVENKVQGIFLIQGALGGSYVADYLRGQGRAIDSRLPIAASLTLKMMKEAEQFIDPLIESSLTAITTKVAKDELASLYSKHSKAVPLVSQKLYYITGADTAAKTSKILSATQAYLSTYYGPNDGLVMVNHQSIPKFGTVVAHFADADHADLTSPYPISADYSMRRVALAKAIALTSIE